MLAQGRGRGRELAAVSLAVPRLDAWARRPAAGERVRGPAGVAGIGRLELGLNRRGNALPGVTLGTIGRSRRGVGRGLALALLLACFASVNSSEHHDSSFRGDAVGARRGDVAATAGADAIPAVPVSRPPEGLGRRTPRAALGKASTAKEKSHLDVHALRRRAEELDDAMVDEDDALDALDESRSADLETPATGAEYALLEIEAAAAEAEARAFDEAFPELVRFQDEDEDAAGERSAAFHRRAEEAQTREAADGSVGTTTQTQSKRSPRDRATSESSKSSRSRLRRRRRAAEGAEEATADTTSALIELLTRRAPRAESGRGGVRRVPLRGARRHRGRFQRRRRGWRAGSSPGATSSTGTLDPAKWTPRANASAPGLERFGGQQQWYDPSECRVAGGALALRTRRRAGGTTSSWCPARAQKRGGVPVRVLLGGHRADVLADVRPR